MLNLQPDVSMNQIRMHTMIQERTKERLEGWKIHLLDRFFSLNRLHHPASLGIFSWSSEQIHVKWMHRYHARNYGGGWVTPGDIARDYLALKYPKRRIRITTAQWQACVKDRRDPPLFCIPGVHEDCVYIDLTACYWQIVRAVGWDVSYLPGKWLTVNSIMDDFPYWTEKMARNCLVSVGVPNRMRFWTGSEQVFLDKPNRFVNLVLYRCVMDVMNTIASDMVSLGAQYVYTDGYIFKREDMPSACRALDDWQLEYTFKHEGRTDIRAPTSYKIGDYETQTFKRNRNLRTSNKVYNGGGDWLRQRFARAAERGRWFWDLRKET